jgi:hypothetical protein
VNEKNSAGLKGAKVMTTKMKLGIAVVYSVAGKVGSNSWTNAVYEALRPLNFTFAEADWAIRLSRCA